LLAVKNSFKLNVAFMFLKLLLSVYKCIHYFFNKKIYYGQKLKINENNL